jgi:hypothetical protein
MPAERRRRRRLLLIVLLALSAVPSITTSMISIALFADDLLLAPDAWAPAPVDVRAEPALVLEASGMVPGDMRSGELVVDNLGVDPIRYAIVTTTSDPDAHGLGDALVAELRAGAGCGARTGDLLYSGPLSGLAMGDPVAGTQSGDRLLGPAERELLCLRVTLPVGSPNIYQDASATTTLTVTAEREDR